MAAMQCGTWVSQRGKGSSHCHPLLVGRLKLPPKPATFTRALTLHIEHSMSRNTLTCSWSSWWLTLFFSSLL